MDGYKDAHTHIHPTAAATKAFMDALEFHGPGGPQTTRAGATGHGPRRDRNDHDRAANR